MNTTDRFSRIRKMMLLRILVALVTTAGALAVGRMLAPVTGDQVAYIVALAAVSFCAWYCGLIPSSLSALLATAVLKFWVLPPVHTLRFSNPRQILDLLIFLLASALLIAMAEVHRRDNQTLRIAQGELETRVQERTAELDLANQSLRELTARVMQLQDEERRRIARELHDSVGQMLAALSMNLVAVGTGMERLQEMSRKVADSAGIVKEMQQEVRTISYLLHPPLLDEAGLASALRWYIQGFSERSKLQVELEVAEDFGRLPQDLETAIFRTVQECLTNIHRHSESPVAKICLRRSSNEIHLKVEDSGVGMPPEKLNEISSAGTPGVGIRGMRERLRQLGGTLEIRSTKKGTTVETRLPFAVSAAAIAGETAA